MIRLWSDEEFTQRLAETKVTDYALANYSRFSLLTVRRWRKGKNLPAQALRPGVIAAVTALEGVLKDE